MADSGIIARFDTAGELITAVRAARIAGYRRFDAFAPFPVPGLKQAIGFDDRRITVLALIAGVVAAALGYFLQWYSGVIDYPFVVGGKPLHSWPAFLLVTFEVGILAAVLTAVVTMLAANGLPRPYHPAFNWPAFDRASADGFFLLIEDGDPADIKNFMREQQAAEIGELPP